jgi:hypothetical protein
VTTEEIIIAVVRVLGSLPVLWFPFPGALIAVLTDLSDLFLMNLLHEGGVRDYQEFDKWLDQAYMATFLIVALRWKAAPRNIAVGLFAYRLVGFVAFEVTQERGLLIFFPNVFEFWFIFVSGVQFFGLEAGVVPSSAPPGGRSRGPAATGAHGYLFPFRYSFRQLAVVLPALLAAKLLQEYALHVGQWFEGFTAVEAVEWIWRTLTPPY